MRFIFTGVVLAAVVYLGRDYLERPKTLASRNLTQEVVARHFGLTRRQLTHAIDRVSQPKFARPTSNRPPRRDSK